MNKEAISLLERAENAFPRNGALHFWLGRAYFESGEEYRTNKDFAARQLLLAVKGCILFCSFVLLKWLSTANSLDANAFAILGRLYEELGDADRARRSHAKVFFFFFLFCFCYVYSLLTNYSFSRRLSWTVLKRCPLCFSLIFFPNPPTTLWPLRDCILLCSR
jgi:tetratricopeptide (TPR) repeat protein